MKNGLVGILVEANKWMYIQAKGVYNELASPWGNQHGNEHANMKTTYHALAWNTGHCCCMKYGNLTKTVNWTITMNLTVILLPPVRLILLYLEN